MVVQDARLVAKLAAITLPKGSDLLLLLGSIKGEAALAEPRWASGTALTRPPSSRAAYPRLD